MVAVPVTGRTRFEAVCAKMLVSCRKVMVINIIEVSMVSGLLSLFSMGLELGCKSFISLQV